ncbi:hypothetical protein ScPMuIL_011340 [Solemya velum]
MAKKIAVIGAGASGLTAVKCCLDEDLELVCYERTESIGGLWYFTPEIRDGQGCINKSTVVNSSKEMMCFSDFPMPQEYPVFIHNTYVMKYLDLYAENFKLKKYIKFQTEVLHVSRADDFAQTGQWKVEIRDNKTGKQETKTFDGVLVCTGHLATQNIPHFKGMDEFAGDVIHSREYKRIENYVDKRVLIVGTGNSGGDIATELGQIASQVFLSTRRGTWVLNRVADNGMPFDMLLLSRFVGFLFWCMPTSLLNWVLERKLNQRFDHGLYSLKPNHGPLSQAPLINDDLPNRIVCGSVKIKTDVTRFTKTGVEFVDGTVEDNIDSVILATGYVYGFPFLDKSVLNVNKNKVNLYKYVFPPDLERATLAVVGCIQPRGATMPISEMQCRLACRVFKGDVILPSRSDMWDDIRQKANSMSLHYVKSQRYTIQVDYVQIMDELASLNGCKPNFYSLFLRDPRLAFSVAFGSCTPYQYRLQGPGCWDGACDAIRTQWDRTLYPLKTRPIASSQHSFQSKLLLYSIALLFFAIIIKLFLSG